MKTTCKMTLCVCVCVCVCVWCVCVCVCVCLFVFVRCVGRDLTCITSGTYRAIQCTFRSLRGYSNKVIFQAYRATQTWYWPKLIGVLKKGTFQSQQHRTNPRPVSLTLVMLYEDVEQMRNTK
jgi:hypothetical protein